MTTRTRNLSIILGLLVAFVLYLFCVAMNASIRQKESEVRAKHETAEKIRAARGY
jgi:large-conductance mechanosensitive channel